jgi:hypothetical protein
LNSLLAGFKTDAVKMPSFLKVVREFLNDNHIDVGSVCRGSFQAMSGALDWRLDSGFFPALTARQPGAPEDRAELFPGV